MDLRVFDGYFRFQGKVIWYYEYEKTGQRIIVYLNEQLRENEISDYLHKLEKEGIDIKDSEFYKKQHEFGTLALTFYIKYKSRYQVEQMIDVFKKSI